MLSHNLWSPLNQIRDPIDFKEEYDSAILKEFGPHSNSKCFTEEKRVEYIEKLLSADITRELPKQLRGFCLGDANTQWEQAEWRFKSNTSEKIHLWTKKTFSSSAKNLGITRRIIVLEEFFDLIKCHHGRPNRDGYNGQKKLFNMIKNRYACLPRDAVDKYITMWRRATSQVSQIDRNNSRSPSELEKEWLNQSIPRGITMGIETMVSDNNVPSSTTMETPTTTAAAAVKVEAAGRTMPPLEEDRRKRNSCQTETGNVTFVDNLHKFSGISMVYQPPVISELKITHSPLLNIKYQVDNGGNQLAALLSENHFSKQDCDSSNQGSSKENSFENEDLIPNKRMRLDEGYSETNTDNDETNDDTISNLNGDPSLNTNGLKRPSDIDMAYNIFVRRLIDGTLDRTVTFCEQPKYFILGLENICAEAFPAFEKSRHRIKIRGYLKACRRNSKKHNGRVSMKDTPSHMCSDKAYSIANEALVRVQKDLETLKLLRPGDIGVNQLNIPKPAADTAKEGSKNDGKCSEYMDLMMSSGNLNPVFPIAPCAPWSDNEQFCAVLANFLPSLYGMIPLPSLLTPTTSIGGSAAASGGHGEALCPPAPPAAHTNQYFNSLPGSLFSVMDGCAHYSETSHLLGKMLHCSSIDPDFGMELVVNRSASQEAINCMRVTARYLLSRSVMMESYLIKETNIYDNLTTNEKS